MLKVVKEIIIYILLIALIALIFGILFYDQLPSNKLVPAKVEYNLPEKLEEELKQTLSEDEEKEVLVTYSVEESDLDKFKGAKKYDPGKIDPFSDYTAPASATGEANNSGTVGSSTNTTTGGGTLTETKPGK